jgi:aryl-alcohol dehydrogenase-like predicted oxidoreductase
MRSLTSPALRTPIVTASIVGGRSAKQVEELAPALEFRLATDEYARINTFLSSNPV